MKKIVFAVTALILTSELYAGGIWDMVKNASSDGTIKTKQYTMEVAGVDTRAYVFYVKEMDSVCVQTYSSHGIPAISCKTMKEIKAN